MKCESWRWGIQTLKFSYDFFVGIAWITALGSESLNRAGIVLFPDKYTSLDSRIEHIQLAFDNTFDHSLWDVGLVWVVGHLWVDS